MNEMNANFISMVLKPKVVILALNRKTIIKVIMISAFFSFLPMQFSEAIIDRVGTELTDDQREMCISIGTRKGESFATDNSDPMLLRNAAGNTFTIDESGMMMYTNGTTVKCAALLTDEIFTECFDQIFSNDMGNNYPVDSYTIDDYGTITFSDNRTISLEGKQLVQYIKVHFG